MLIPQKCEKIEKCCVKKPHHSLLQRLEQKGTGSFIKRTVSHFFSSLLNTRIGTDTSIASHHVFDTNVTLKYNMKYPYHLNKSTKNIGERNHA